MTPFLIIVLIAIILIVVFINNNKKKRASLSTTSIFGTDAKPVPVKQEVFMENHIPETLQRTGFQAIESLFLIGTSKYFDVITRRYKFLLSILNIIKEASEDAGYLSNKQKFIEDYKSLYDRNLESYQINFINNPIYFDLPDFYCNSLYNSFIINFEDQIDQIKNLKREEAINKRKEKIRELLLNTVNEIKSECSSASSFSNIILKLKEKEISIESIKGNTIQETKKGFTKPKTKEDEDALNRNFRRSDMVNYREDEMVLGFEIIRSNGGDFNCEICKAGLGKYPKNFHWEGWHEGCMCHTVPLTLSNAEFDKWIGGSGSKSFLTRRYIKDIPESIKIFVQKNIDSSSNEDWFVQNGKYFK